MNFIQLTFYYYDKSFPEKSLCTKKKFWQKVSNISRITPYQAYNEASGRKSLDSSTKIVLESGEIIEVCETVNEILDKIKKT